MKVSTEIGSIARHVGYEKAVEMVAKAGFDAWDFSMFYCYYNFKEERVEIRDDRFLRDDYLDFARKLAEIGKAGGIHCNQSHAPFATKPKMLPYIERAMRCTAAAGGKICIVHPWNGDTPAENAETYAKLIPIADELGITIATENMWNWDRERDVAAPAACSLPDNFNAHLDAVPDGKLVACLDIGHAEMFRETSAPEMIRALGKRLKALHIHDNDRWHDSHAIPFSMNIDFEAVADALAEIKYDGYLTLEADSHVKGGSEEEVFAQVCELYAAVNKLRIMVEERMSK